MKVILLSDVKNVGKKDEVVEVADGYARNFLIKRKLAVAQTQGSMQVLGRQQEEARLREEESQNSWRKNMISTSIAVRSWDMTPSLRWETAI